MRFSALGENTAPAAEDIFPSTDISDSGKDKKVTFANLANLIKTLIFGPSEESYTYNGLTITAVRTGGCVQIKVNGTPSAEIASGSDYVTIATVSAPFRPTTNGSFIAYQTYGSSGKRAQINVTNAGNVRIGYSRALDGTAENIAAGQSVFLQACYAGRAFT